MKWLMLDTCCEEMPRFEQQMCCEAPARAAWGMTDKYGEPQPAAVAQIQGLNQGRQRILAHLIPARKTDRLLHSSHGIFWFFVSVFVFVFNLLKLPWARMILLAVLVGQNENSLKQSCFNG